MSEKAHRELTIPNDTACLSQVRKAVLEVLGRGLFAPGEAHLIALAVDEAIANIIEHAFPPGQRQDDAQIQILLDADHRLFRALIRDTGRRFDPTAVPNVDITRHMREGRKGGLGIYIIRRIMDEIAYTFRHGKYNELLLVKYVDNAGSGTKSRRS